MQGKVIILDNSAWLCDKIEKMSGFWSKIWYVFRIPLCLVGVNSAISMFYRIMSGNLVDLARFRVSHYPLFVLCENLALLYVCWLLIRREGTFRKVFSLHPVPPGILGCAFVLGCCMPLLWQYGIWHLVFGRSAEDLGDLLPPDLTGPWFHAGWFVALVVGVVYKETVYRGVILKRMLEVFKPSISLTVNALLPVMTVWFINLVILLYASMGPYPISWNDIWSGQGMLGKLFWFSWSFGYEIMTVCVLGFVFWWTRSLWATISLGLGGVIACYGNKHILRLLISMDLPGTAIALIVPGGAIAASLVYLCRRRIRPAQSAPFSDEDY